MSLIPSNKLDTIKFQLLYVNNRIDYAKKLSDMINDLETIRLKIYDLSKINDDFSFVANLDSLTKDIKSRLGSL